MDFPYKKVLLAGCPERIDPEFAQWIENFNTNTRPVMLKTLEDSGVPYKLFTAREAAYAWLNGFDSKLYPDTPVTVKGMLCSLIFMIFSPACWRLTRRP